MKTFLIFLLSITVCYAQDHYIKLSDIQSVLIKKNTVQYDTLRDGAGVAYKLIITDFGLMDSSKLIIVKYEAFQIEAEAEPKPDAPADTIDSEELTYVDWDRHGPTNPSTAGWYANTISYSNKGEVRYQYFGKKLEIWGETGPNNGTATITSGTVVRKTDVSWKGTQKLPVLIYTVDNPQGTTIIKPNGDGNILIDFIVLK